MLEIKSFSHSFDVTSIINTNHVYQRNNNIPKGIKMFLVLFSIIMSVCPFFVFLKENRKINRNILTFIVYIVLFVKLIDFYKFVLSASFSRNTNLKVNIYIFV